MPSTILKRVRIAVMLFLAFFPVLGLVGTSQASGYSGGIPWQVDDVIICFGSGTCNVVRIESGSPVLLDQFSDGLDGATFGVAINNTLHAVVTDNGGGGQSNVVVFSIASVNPTTVPATTVAHTHVQSTDYDPNNAQTIVVNSIGHMFVGNAGSGGSQPTIVELTPTGTLASPSALPHNPFTLPAGCTDTQGNVLSMDLNAAGSSLYLTSGGGTIQQLTLATGTCTPFANFGSNVTLYGIKDIPPGALTGNCGSSVTPSAACPTPDETLLVVARGFIDPGGFSVDICTDAMETNPDTPTTESCALLLDTNSNDPGLVAPLWKSGTQYSLSPVDQTILDPYLELQRVYIAGTSGSSKPSFSETGGKAIDNAAIWTNQGQPMWHPDTPFAPAPFPGTYIVDSNSNLQTVTAAGAGTSGPATPSWSVSGTTVDGLQWTDQGTSVWMPNTHYFTVGTLISDLLTHAQKVTQAGTSASSGIQPVSGWNDLGGNTIEGVTWLESHPTWAGGSLYAVSAIIMDNNNHVQLVQQAGTSASGLTPPNFNEGGTTNDNTVTWVDIGQAVWRPSFSYGLNAIIVDSGGHVQQVTSAGTTGSTTPIFLDEGSSTTPDNTVMWTDRGPLAGSGTFTWQATTAYAVNAEIVDSADHVELVTIAGTSGPGPSAPAFVDGGNVVDNTVTWADLGQAVWRANFSYGLNAIIVDGNGDVEQVTTAGTTGSSMPSFSMSPTTDGSVVWTNLGSSASTAFTWQASTPYNLNTMIVDINDHVELATTNPSGTSGGGLNPPAFADGGSVVDGLIWADQGQPAWIPDHSYSMTGAFIVDTHNNLETVSIPGISGHQTPAWMLSGTTIDGLIWADQNKWLPTHQYFAAGAAVGDTSGHVHTVLTTGTSGSGPSTPAGGWNDVGSTNGGLTLPGTTIDNAVIWTESHLPWQMNHAYTVGNPDTLILDTNAPIPYVQLVTTTGVSGPSQPNAVGNNAWNETPTKTTIDGLEWVNQVSSPDTSVVARYPVTGVTTLQSLALDPLVANCTSITGTEDCSSIVPPPTISNFWLGDNGSPNFYKLDFATGTPTEFSANAPWQKDTLYALGAAILDPAGHAQKVTTAGTSGGTQPAFSDSGGTVTDGTVKWTDQGLIQTVASIQGLDIYGAEGANQADLTKLSTTSLNSGNHFTAEVTFPPPVSPFVGNDINTWALTEYAYPSGPAPTTTALTLYASLIAQASAAPNGNNSGITDVSSTPPSVPCEPTTTEPGKCIIWKADLLVPAGDYLAENLSSPTGIDNGTNVFVDLQYNVTSSVGNVDPPGHSSGSVHSLHEITTTFSSSGPNSSGCFFVSPAPEGASFKSNRGTLPFVFQCTNLTPTQFDNLSKAPGPPLLSMVETFPTMIPKPAPQTVFLTTTNGKAPFRLSGNEYVFNWSPNGIKGTFRACTFDPTNTVQTFCVDFTMK